MAAVTLLAGCAGERPEGLRCELQTGDVLVEAGSAPRMSWINSRPQKAYQIIVSTSRKQSKGDAVWDSGPVESGESHLVPYEGPALEPLKVYYWKVRTWGENGKVSGWSEPARWTTGPTKDGWDASWIGASWQRDERGEWYTRCSGRNSL